MLHIVPQGQRDGLGVASPAHGFLPRALKHRTLLPLCVSLFSPKPTTLTWGRKTLKPVSPSRLWGKHVTVSVVGLRRILVPSGGKRTLGSLEDSALVECHRLSVLCNPCQQGEEQRREAACLSRISFSALGAEKG